MLKGKKDINSGDNSINIQSDRITVKNEGLSYLEVRQVAMDIFKANFYELSQVANKIAVERAEELVNTFLSKMEQESPSIVNKIQDPDVQYVVINAQKHYARMGDPERLELLTDLLKNRFQAKEESFKTIVLNESIDIMPTLTINHMRFLTALLLVKNGNLAKARVLIEALSRIIADETTEFQSDNMFFEHLIFSRVVKSDVTVSSSQNLEYFISANYADELDEKIDGGTLAEIEPPVRRQFSIDALSESVFENWNNSLINRYSLTSVGIAIAVAYYNVTMGTDVKLDIWIKG